MTRDQFRTHYQWRKWRTCLSKRKRKKSRADNAVTAIAKKYKIAIYYYVCPFCTKYHLTKQEPR